MRSLRYCISLIALIVAGITCGITFAIQVELAKVDGVVIKDSDFLNRVKLLPERGRVNLDKERFLNKMIDEELILREAQKLNLYDNPEYKLRVENYKRELLVDLYLQQYLREKSTDENLKKYYEEKKEKYTSPEMVKISVITLKTEGEAKEVLKKAKEGEDFAELAKKYSKGANAAQGGDYGFRARGGLRTDFSDVAFLMKIGELKGPIKAGDEYHIIKLMDRREEKIFRFEDVKKKVSSDYAKKVLDEKFAELRKAAKITIDSAALKNLKIE